jgi:hypothetical protein
MTDLVDELRFQHRRVTTSGTWFDADKVAPIMKRAADEIERLRAALKPFASLSIHPDAPDDGLVIVTDTSGGIIDTGKNRILVRDIRRATAAQ